MISIQEWRKGMPALAEKKREERRQKKSKTSPNNDTNDTELCEMRGASVSGV